MFKTGLAWALSLYGKIWFVFSLLPQVGSPLSSFSSSVGHSKGQVTLMYAGVALTLLGKAAKCPVFKTSFSRDFCLLLFSHSGMDSISRVIHFM